MFSTLKIHLLYDKKDAMCGAAFELGRYEIFELRRLITTSAMWGFCEVIVDKWADEQNIEL